MLARPLRALGVAARACATDADPSDFDRSALLATEPARACPKFTRSASPARRASRRSARFERPIARPRSARLLPAYRPTTGSPLHLAVSSPITRAMPNVSVATGDARQLRSVVRVQHAPDFLYHARRVASSTLVIPASRIAATPPLAIGRRRRDVRASPHTSVRGGTVGRHSRPRTLRPSRRPPRTRDRIVALRHGLRQVATGHDKPTSAAGAPDAPHGFEVVPCSTPSGAHRVRGADRPSPASVRPATATMIAIPAASHASCRCPSAACAAAAVAGSGRRRRHKQSCSRSRAGTRKQRLPRGDDEVADHAAGHPRPARQRCRTAPPRRNRR